jgi:tetratricopeptide (TPR) repeat protein
MPTVVVIGTTFLLLLLAGVLWRAFGPGPRRQRAYRQAQRLLDAGDWHPALRLAEEYLSAAGSESWKSRLRTIAGESRQQATEQSLKEKQFEQAWDHARQASDFLGLDPDEQRARVVEAMLAEVRSLFAAGGDQNQATREMIRRTRELAKNSGGTIPPESTFWDALCLIREGHLESALPLLTEVSEQIGRQYIDPAFYLGVLLHRLGRPQEALRSLGEANRVDPACPFVTWQMGVSIVSAGGDNSLALRALQRALGPRGLLMWQGNPDRVWVEAFPEGKSYVRRLASKHHFVCPLLGGELATIIRQGQLALAQAFSRAERFQEAADLYGKLLENSPPTVMLLRGYGLALARLGHHDHAYKQLRIALEQEDPKDPFTAGYLAVCGALGKPTRPEDKPRNIQWGLRLLARYPVLSNEEWANLIATIHAEARLLEVPLSAEDQLLACDALASVQATDPRAAATYAHLAATFPQEIRPVHAWLYARAACEHGATSPADMDLFGRTFQDAPGARTFFTSLAWDFDEVEYTFLERASLRAPGQFPEVLGSDYPARGEAFLLERSRKFEESGRKDQSRRCVEVLLALAPASLAGHDRLACLHYRRGDLDQAVALLDNLHRLAPHDHWPLVRQAILEQERGNAERRAQAIDRALGLTSGPQRAAVAFLGARLALREGSNADANGESPGTAHKPDVPARDQPTRVFAPSPTALHHSRQLLQICLHDDPDHVEALWCLAAVQSAQGDHESLAHQAPLMNRPSVQDARFHYLGAVCHLAARDYRRVVELAERAALDTRLEVESQFLAACAHLHLDNPGAAQTALQKVAAADNSPSAVYARALLGKISLAREDYGEAARWWAAVDARHRAEWHLDEPLRQSVLLAGLQDLETGRYEQAADRFREAGRLGLRDRRLGGLITLALVQAGQQLLYGLHEPEAPARGTRAQSASEGSSQARSAVEGTED